MLFQTQLFLLPYKDFLIQEYLCSVKVPQCCLLGAQHRNESRTSLCSADSLTDCKENSKFVPILTEDSLILQHGNQRIRFRKQVIPATSLPPPTKVSSPQYSSIRETSSEVEKLNKAVKPHFCNYVQQLHKNQNFFMSED